METYCILKTCCNISVSFSTKCHLFHNFIFSYSNNTFFTIHALRFKYHSHHLKVKELDQTRRWNFLEDNYTVIKDHEKQIYMQKAQGMVIGCCEHNSTFRFHMCGISWPVDTISFSIWALLLEAGQEAQVLKQETWRFNPFTIRMHNKGSSLLWYDTMLTGIKVPTL
jgi:hypothetical protein